MKDNELRVYIWSIIWTDMLFLGRKRRKESLLGAFRCVESQSISVKMPAQGKCHAQKYYVIYLESPDGSRVVYDSSGLFSLRRLWVFKNFVYVCGICYTLDLTHALRKVQFYRIRSRTNSRILCNWMLMMIVWCDILPRRVILEFQWFLLVESRVKVRIDSITLWFLSFKAILF